MLAKTQTMSTSFFLQLVPFRFWLISGRCLELLGNKLYSFVVVKVDITPALS